MIVKKRALEKQLRAAGCVFVRHGGKHDIWLNPETDIPFTIPRSGVKTRKIYLNIMKQAGIEK